MPRNAATKKFLQRTQNAAISLDGSTSFLAKASPTGINNGTNGSVTIAGWVKLKASTLGTVAELHVNGGTSPSFGMGEIGGLYFVFSDRVNVLNNKIIMATQFNQYVGLNRWVFLTYILTPTTFSLYAGDTALLSNSALATAINAGTISNFFIGKGQTTAQADIQFLNGIVKDFRVYNGALTAQQVSDLYYSALNASTVADAWGMDEGAGSTVTDAIGTNNLTGTALTWTSDRPFAAKKASVNANMVKNGNFEYAPPFTAATTTANRYIDGTASGSTTNNLFGGWSLQTIATAVSAQFDTSVFHSGTASMKLSTTNASGSVAVFSCLNSGGTVTATNSAEFFNLSPNTTYTLSGYVKTSNTLAARIRITELTQAQGIGTTTSTTSVVGTNDWTFCSVTFTTAATARFGLIRLANDTAGNISDAWFDDLSLLPVYPEGRVPANGNLVKNFDFEVAPSGGIATTTQGRWVDGTAGGSTTNATYKWKGQSGANNTAVVFDPTVFRSGAYSLKLSATDTAGSFYVDIGAGIASTQPVETLKSFAIPVAGGISYTLIGWIKTNNVPTNGAFLQLTTYDSAGTRLDNVGSSVKLTGTQDWTQITIAQAINARAAWATIGLMKNVAGNVSDAWFDDIYFAPTTNPGRVIIT